MFTRIQWRIAASYVLLIAVALLALGVYLAYYLRQEQLHQLEMDLRSQALIIAQQVAPQLQRGDASQIDAFAKRVGRAADVRITIIDRTGRVLGDTDHDPTTMDNHLSRPEVRQALASGFGESMRHSRTLDRDLLYVAVPIGSGGDTLGVARVAMPTSDVQASLNRVVTVVGAATAIAIVLAILLALVVARATTSNIARLTSAARSMAAGQLHQRIEIDGRDETSELASAFNEMAQSLDSYISTISRERERMSAVLSYMADSLLITNGRGEVQAMNRAAEQLLGVREQDVRGRSVMAVIRDHELAGLVRRALEMQGPVRLPRLLELGGDGNRRLIDALASPIPGENGTGSQVLLLLRDVTELRRAETIRQEFVANVSHELRTPVAALKSLVETLEEGALEDEEVARDFLARMHVEVDKLAQLIEELLELSRIESGRVELRIQPVNLVEVVRAGVERLRPQAERQGVLLEVLPQRPEIAAMADPERIQQVVINLVHNAIKFTPPGGSITVHIYPSGREVAVAVEDTGVGIEPELLDRLFERFFKVDRARSAGGTGLGLAIAKHLVLAHRGRIWAESEGVGKGARFTFTLPAVGAV